MLTAQAATAQSTCVETPVFAESPPPIDVGYFTSDIGMDGSGNVAIIGEFRGETDNDVFAAGTARIFSQSNGQWDEVETIQHNSPLQEDGFGISVDVSGSLAIISAPGAAFEDLGAAYIFERDIQEPVGEQWDQQSVIDNPSLNNGFGGNLAQHEAVAIDGSLAAVSASATTVNNQQGAGSVFVYSYDAVLDMWVLEEELVAPSPQFGANFGHSIEISGDRIIIGAPNEDDQSFSEAGAAYVFKRNPSGTTTDWLFEARLSAINPSADDHFGNSVSIDGNAALVGAPSDSGTGSATFFRFSGAGIAWSALSTLTPTNSQSDQLFGYNVSLDGTFALIGASSYDVGSENDVGGAYLFQYSTGGWSQVQQMLSIVGASGDRVGETLALSGDEAFVGALGEDFESGNITLDQAGAVLIFSDLPTFCTQ